MHGKKNFILLFVFSISLFAHADKLEKGFERLQVYDYFLAKKYFEQSLENKAAGASYGLSLIFSTNNNPFYNLDSARIYLLLSDSSYKKDSEKQKIYYAKLGVTDSSILSLKGSLCAKGFEAIAFNTSVDVLNKYISDFSFCPEIQKAIELRNTTAFNIAREINTAEAYADFINTYSEANEVKEARQRHEERLYIETTADKSLMSYVNFLQLYPRNSYRSQAEKMVYALSTTHKTIEEYYLFIKKFPSNHFVNDAWREIYKLSMQDYNGLSVAEFKKKFPDYPFKNELEEDVRLQSTMFLPINKNELWGYIDEEGKETLKPQYAEVNLFSEGLAVILKSGKFGYIGKTGKEIIQPAFEEAESFRNNVAVVKKNGKYGLINRSNETLIPFQYDDLTEPSEGICVAVLNDKSGYVSQTGKKITEFIFDIANDFKNGYAIVSKDDAYGLLNSDGNFTIGQKYDELIFITDELLKAKKEGRWGILNSYEAIILPFEYDAIGDLHENRILIAKNKKLGFADEKGKIIIPLTFPFTENMLTIAKFKNGHAVLFQKNKPILIDSVGAKIPMPLFEDMGSYSEGLIPVRKNKKWGYADINGKIKIQYKYEWAAAFENGFAKVRLKTGTGVIDNTGKMIIDAAYADIELKNDYFIVKTKGEKLGLLSRDGQMLLMPSSGYDRIDFLSEKIVVAYTGESKTYFNTASGKIIWSEL
jgi:hypothetical protein